MSKAILCDKCSKPAVILGDDEEYNRQHDDFQIIICGDTVARYGDLCEACATDITGVLIDSLGDSFIEVEEEIPADMDEVGEITDLPKDMLENVDGFNEEEYSEAIKEKAIDSLAVIRGTKEYKEALEAINGELTDEDLWNVLA